MLVTRTESPMTIYTFIRDRIDDGSLVLLPGRKKSRKILSLSPQLEAALNEFLIRRYIVGAPHQESDDTGHIRETHWVVPVTNFAEPEPAMQDFFELAGQDIGQFVQQGVSTPTSQAG